MTIANTNKWFLRSVLVKAVWNGKKIHKTCRSWFKNSRFSITLLLDRQLLTSSLATWLFVHSSHRHRDFTISGCLPLMTLCWPLIWFLCGLRASISTIPASANPWDATPARCPALNRFTPVFVPEVLWAAALLWLSQIHSSDSFAAFLSKALWSFMDVGAGHSLSLSFVLFREAADSRKLPGGPGYGWGYVLYRATQHGQGICPAEFPGCSQGGRDPQHL